MLALELAIQAGRVPALEQLGWKLTLQLHSSAAGPGRRPASSRVLCLCGCRAVPKAKLPFQKGGKKKKINPHFQLTQA